jgi:hypothetical protein
VWKFLTGPSATPWITDKEAPPIDYHFSYLARRFENMLLKFRQTDTGSMGLLWIVLHNQVLSIPYVFAGNASLYPHMSKYILRTMIDSGVKHATLRNQELSNGLLQNKGPFLLTRNMHTAYICPRQAGRSDSHWKKSCMTEDGDVMFTG